MRLRILILEDNCDARTALRELLELWGHDVIEADNGVAALQSVVDLQPDVAIMDLALPGGMDGYQVAQALTVRSDCPVLIAFTGYSRPEDKAHAFAAGFDFFVLKPGGIDDLHALLSVSEMHARKRGRYTDIPRFGSVTPSPGGFRTGAPGVTGSRGSWPCSSQRHACSSMTSR